MSTHNLCFEQIYEEYQNFLAENFHFLVVEFSVYLNRRVFVMCVLFFLCQDWLIVGTDSLTETLFSFTDGMRNRTDALPYDLHFLHCR